MDAALLEARRVSYGVALGIHALGLIDPHPAVFFLEAEIRYARLPPLTGRATVALHQFCSGRITTNDLCPNHPYLELFIRPGNAGS
jgi:hypothetical protein